ncbi:MAG: hypothetical protein KDD02_10415 [Phaeodactylibacter sp.]|nr:hypothetical protein [Phaeodactylibacter sp.]
MKIIACFCAFSWILALSTLHAQEADSLILSNQGNPYPLYPKTVKIRPDISSPYLSADGQEVVPAVTEKGEYTLIPVTVGGPSAMVEEDVVDAKDFPTVARTGLHSLKELERTHSITGRSIEEINHLARPGGLSQDGFLAAGEDIISVLKQDNELVKAMGLTHPQMAKPLFHVLNMMQACLDQGDWNMAHHRWEYIHYALYHDKVVFLDAHDTKGGQLSIFDDGIMGGFWILIWREPTAQELAFLKEKYGHLEPPEFESLLDKLTHMLTGEIEPQYIQRYGFYEGHTGWRVDPIAIAFIFGLRSIEEIEAAFPGGLYDQLAGKLAY